MKKFLEFVKLALNAIRKRVRRLFWSMYKKRNPKIFCIGQNKTGTTSIKVAFEDLGYFVGNQRRAERLNREYFNGNFEAIIRYCHSAQVFQDVPFSWPETYKHLDRAFPDAKFILTIRDNPEQWFQSRVRFDTKRFGHAPTLEDLKKSKYVRKGWAYENFRHFYGDTHKDPWDKEARIKRYDDYNKAVEEYFKGRENKLLVVNVADPESYKRLCAFVGVNPKRETFPWENKS